MVAETESASQGEPGLTESMCVHSPLVVNDHPWLCLRALAARDGGP